MRRARFASSTMTAAALVAVAAASRLAPHPPNFTPVAAMALFSGACLPAIGPAFAVPLTAMLASDAVLGFHDQMPAVYLGFALTVCLGRLLRARRGPARILAVTLCSSLLFFALSNFGAWLALYPRTAAGLAECFVQALPFFRNTLLGDALYAAALFSGYAMLRRGRVAQVRTAVAGEGRGVPPDEGDSPEILGA